MTEYTGEQMQIQVAQATSLEALEHSINAERQARRALALAILAVVLLVVLWMMPLHLPHQ